VVSDPAPGFSKSALFISCQRVYRVTWTGPPLPLNKSEVYGAVSFYSMLDFILFVYIFGALGKKL
jgi:hypothetical protein